MQIPYLRARSLLAVVPGYALPQLNAFCDCKSPYEEVDIIRGAFLGLARQLQTA
jgi:hypothetical protein